jgi:BASS family bile acid:Na+ symporter
MIIKPTPSIALGMILVAACPSGNIAGFLTNIAKGNVELSLTLNAIATIFAIFLTPLNFACYGYLYNETSHIMVPIVINAWQMLYTVFCLLGIPLITGMLFAHRFPVVTQKLRRPLRTGSIIVFFGIIVTALGANFGFFLRYIQLIALIVCIHNVIMILSGYFLAKFTNLEFSNVKTITIESGIHNSGLALVLIFNPKLFNGLGGMAFIAAWWGIWHLITGLAVAIYFSKRKKI